MEETITYSDVSQATFELINALTIAETHEEKECLIENHIKKFDNSSTRCYLPVLRDLFALNTNKSLNFGRDFIGKIVVLDFFTYCCINCLHLLPHLANLEKKYTFTDGLIVIGVHSGKFDNERSSGNVLKAISKLQIEHPVINDEENYLWDKLSVACWPTIFIIGPEQQILFSFIGEGFKDQLEFFADKTLSYFKKRSRINNNTALFSMKTWKTSTEILNFPGKLSFSPNGEFLAVSDSGNHRILMMSNEGTIQFCIGGPEPGYADGKFISSRFRSPQGITWTSSENICIADTENHAIREINLKTKLVRTLYKTNSTQMNECVLRSPWDVVHFHFVQNESTKKIILIAAAGSHQIWAYFFDDTQMLKKNYLMGECVPIAGNGKEENRNNSYPHKAGFAQPSGLSVCNLKGEQHLLIADSESSSIRLMSLVSGKVVGLVGGEFDPLNLFGFGDTDGKGVNVKLQHPMAVAWNENSGLAYVADTYNHKIKLVDIEQKTCKTFLREDKTDNKVADFDEPNGLTFNSNYSILYITDTNNHKIKLLDINSKRLETLAVRWKRRQNRLHPNHVINCKQIKSHPARNVQFNGSITVPNGVHINAEAPNFVEAYIKDNRPLTIKNMQMKSETTSVTFNYVFSNFKNYLLEQSITIEIAAEIYCCEGESCWKRSIVFQLPVAVTDSAKDDIDPIVQTDFCIPVESFK